MLRTINLSSFLTILASQELQDTFQKLYTTGYLRMSCFQYFDNTVVFMVHLSADRSMSERINANHWTFVVFLGQQMADSYWTSYRRIRSTVKNHIKEIYTDADS